MSKRALIVLISLLISSMILSASPNEEIGQPKDIRWQRNLSEVSFKATHNSYSLAHPPNIQIDSFGVWEIELDFGMKLGEFLFRVGHDNPEQHFGLSYLSEWIGNILTAGELEHHPVILKLEAKTANSCSPGRFDAFVCVDRWPDYWQHDLTDSLLTWLGEENWITSDRFTNELASEWPSVAELAGKFVVSLQDNNDNRDIDTGNGYFFIKEIPQLKACWPPIKSPQDLQDAIALHVNRLTMDHVYAESWSSLLSPEDTNSSSAK